MRYKITIPGRLPGLNDFLNKAKSRKGKIIANAQKKSIEEDIRAIALTQLGLTKFKEPVTINYKWIEPNKRRDLDNIAFGKKFINDALVGAGMLKNDGWSNIKAISDEFGFDRDNPRIEVTITEIGR